LRHLAPATKKRRFRGAFRLMLSPQWCQNNASSRTIGSGTPSNQSKAPRPKPMMSSSVSCPDDAGEAKKFRASQQARMRSEHGFRELCAPIFAGDDLDLAAAFVGKGQELFDRQRIRDPFGEPLGARGLIFEILDRVQAPAPQQPQIDWTAMVLEKPLTAG
jgi:hypothetical protein